MKAIRFPFHFDTTRIRQELEVIATSFAPINSIKIKKDHLQGIHLITPAPGGAKDERGFSYLSTPELDQSPYLQSILNTFQCDKFIYRVHNLKAKGKINLHRDADRGLVNNIVRIHIPVTTNDEVYFYVEGERVCMQNGECWFADITQLHEVENRSDTDRLQLMIDCNLNDWWENILIEHGVDLDADLEWTSHSLENLQAMKANYAQLASDLNSEILDKIDRAIARKTAR